MDFNFPKITNVLEPLGKHLILVFLLFGTDFNFAKFYGNCILFPLLLLITD